MPDDESVQERNRRLGRDFERRVTDKVMPDCTLTANFGGGKTDRSTPDVMCLQSPRSSQQKLRLIEAKRNGYVKPDQRDELVEIAEDMPEWGQLEVYYKPSPRGGQKKRIIHPAGQDPEKTREVLEEEFDHVKMEKV